MAHSRNVRESAFFTEELARRVYVLRSRDL